MKYDAFLTRLTHSKDCKVIRLLLLATAVVCATHAPIQAEIILSAGSFSNLNFGASGTSTGTSGTVSRSAGGVASWAPLASQARSSATFGTLKTYASASTDLWFGSSFSSTYGINHTFFQDDLLIDAPGRTGTHGILDVKFTVWGTLAGSRNANTPDYIAFADENATAYVEYQLTAEGGGFFSSGNIRQTRYARGDTAGANFLNIEQIYSIPFVYGTPIRNLKLRVSNSATAITVRDYLFSSSTLSDQENTTYWGGFGAVRDQFGNLVTDYTSSSASGFNYANAVPEPGSATLVATVFGILCSLRRRRIDITVT